MTKNQTILISILVVLLMLCCCVVFGILVFFFGFTTYISVPPQINNDISSVTPVVDSDYYFITQTINNIELKLVQDKYASGLPAVLTLKINGEEQQIGSNYCYFALLSSDAQTLATQCGDNGSYPLVFWDYNSYAKSYIRLTEFAMTLEEGSEVESLIILPLNGVWSGNKFVATYYVDTKMQPQLFVYDLDKGKDKTFDIAFGEYGASRTMAAIPVVSPDGQYILVQSNGNKNLNVYDMLGNSMGDYNTDSSSLMETNPNWSLLLKYKWDAMGRNILYKFPMESDSEYRSLTF